MEWRTRGKTQHLEIPIKLKERSWALHSVPYKKVFKGFKGTIQVENVASAALRLNFELFT